MTLHLDIFSLQFQIISVHFNKQKVSVDIQYFILQLTKHTQISS